MKRQRRAPTDRPTRRRSCVDLQRRRSGWRPVWQQCCSHALHPSDSRRDEPRIRGKSHIDVGEWRQLEAKPDWTRRDCIRTRWGVSLPLYFVNYIHVDCLQLRLDDSQVSWKSNVNHILTIAQTPLLRFVVALLHYNLFSGIRSRFLYRYRAIVIELTLFLDLTAKFLRVTEWHRKTVMHRLKYSTPNGVFCLTPIFGGYCK